MATIWKNSIFLIWLLPAGLSVAALWPHPYAYYQVLRFLVALPAAFIGVVMLISNTRHGLWWAIAFGLTAILFNPFEPVHLSREIWAPINVAVAILFVANMLLGFRPEKAKDSDN